MNRKRALKRLVVTAATALVACASSSTKLESVQAVPEAQRVKMKNFVVVGLVQDPNSRKSFEEEMVKALHEAGVQAASSQALLPVGQAPTREVIQKLVAEKGFDGAVVGRLVDSRTEVRAMPPAGPESDRFYEYYGWAAPVAYSPGYLQTSKTVVIETRVFETAAGTPVFTATSESVDPESAPDVTQPLAKLVVEQLRKDGFV